MLNVALEIEADPDVRPTLLIDMSYLMHRAFHIGYGLSYGNIPTGLLFKFIQSLYTELKKHNAKRYILAVDMPPYYRDLLQDDYKGLRTASEEEYTLQSATLKRFFQTQTTAIVGCQQYEADDIIAQYCKNYPDEKFIIISGDKDLYQCLSENVSVYDPRSKHLTTLESFTEKYKVPSSDWAMMKAIMGDPSDNIIGIDKVGVVSAAKYLNGIASPKLCDKIDSHQQRIEHNLKMVQIPYEGLSVPELDTLTYDISQDSLLEFYTQFGMNSLKSQVSKHYQLINCLSSV